MADDLKTRLLDAIQPERIPSDCLPIYAARLAKIRETFEKLKNIPNTPLFHGHLFAYIFLLTFEMPGVGMKNTRLENLYEDCYTQMMKLEPAVIDQILNDLAKNIKRLHDFQYQYVISENAPGMQKKSF